MLMQQRTGNDDRTEHDHNDVADSVTHGDANQEGLIQINSGRV
jgi:hypothetical protein